VVDNAGLELDEAPRAGTARAKRLLAVLIWLAVSAAAVARFGPGGGVIAIAWLAVGPLLASLLLSPRLTALLAAWAVLLGTGLVIIQPGHRGGFVSHVSVLVLLAAFAVANSVLRTTAQRRLRQVRAVARVAQSALLRPVPAAVSAGRLASRYVSAAAEARIGGDLLEVVSDGGQLRWLIGDARGKGLPAARLAAVAMTSFRDACAQRGLSLQEVARVVDQSVSRAAGDEDFVTALFAELDPRGWLQLVSCGHPTPLRLTSTGDLQALTPSRYSTPLGLHPAIEPSTFTVGPGDRLIFYTDGLLEARDRSGQYFRVEDCLGALRQADLDDAADALLNRLLAHAGRKLDDDVALLLLEATTAPGSCESEPSAMPARPWNTLAGRELAGALAGQD
jgi:phosphoserine phosphatase RsbU/P